MEGGKDPSTEKKINRYIDNIRLFFAVLSAKTDPQITVRIWTLALMSASREYSFLEKLIDVEYDGMSAIEMKDPVARHIIKSCVKGLYKLAAEIEEARLAESLEFLLNKLYETAKILLGSTLKHM